MKSKIILPLLLGATLLACEKPTQDAASDRQPVATPLTTSAPNLNMAAPLIQAATLNQRLPAETMAYFRLPPMWLWLASQEHGLRYATGNEAYVEQAKTIQKGFDQNVIQNLRGLEQWMTEVLFKHSVAPVEIALIASNQPVPAIVIETSLDIQADQVEPLAKRLTDLTPPEISLKDGQIQLAHMTGSYTFDETSKRFTAVIGVTPDVLSASHKSPIGAMEQQIDTSGIGPLIWLDPQKALPIFEPLMAFGDRYAIKMLGLDQSSGFALGYGVSEGKTRLKMLVDMPRDQGIRQFLPVVNHDMSQLKVVGQPRMAFALNIPSSKELNRIVSNIPALKRDFDELQSLSKAEAGLSVDQIVDTFGPTALYVNDDVGAFLMLNLNDMEQYQKLLGHLKRYEGVRYETKTVDGLEIHHLVFPNLFWGEVSKIPYVKTVSSHLYWTEEGSHLTIAALPQLLIERHGRDKQPVGAWLQQEQGVDFNAAVLALTGRIQDLPRDSYYNHLGLVSLLADATGADFDPYRFPTAQQLQLPDSGSFGLMLSNNEQFLGMELSFEFGVSDAYVSFNNSMTAVAAVGVLAAIAIPAYQDYLERARIQSGGSI